MSGLFLWLRFIVGAVFILLGLAVFFIEIFGVYRFKYVLNRMHAAAMGDTLGLASSIIGLIILNGINFTSLKLLCVIVFLWLASPVASHLIAQLEITVNKDSGRYEVINDISELEKKEEDENDD